MKNLFMFNLRRYGFILGISCAICILCALIQILDITKYKEISSFFIGVINIVFIICCVLELYNSFSYENSMLEHLTPIGLKKLVAVKYITFLLSYLIIGSMYSYVKLVQPYDSVVYSLNEPFKFYLYSTLNIICGFSATISLLILVVLISKNITKGVKAGYLAITLYIIFLISIQKISGYIEWKSLDQGINIIFKAAGYNSIRYREYFLFSYSETLLGGGYYRARDIIIGIGSIIGNYGTLLITSIISWWLLSRRRTR